MQEKPVYLLMNKPAGYVCKACADRNKTVFELLPHNLQALVQGAKRGERLHTVGRLDLDTTGLLILTTDGKFSHRLTAPEYNVQKKYLVELETPVGQEARAVYEERAANGLLLPAEKKAPPEMCSGAKIEFYEPGAGTTTERANSEPPAAPTARQCIITVTEGKFHEVRRIFRALGNRVVKLKRIQMGELMLDAELGEGAVRPLTEEELARLM